MMNKISDSTYIPEKIIYLASIFKSAGYDFYLVGGCVRDIVMNKKPHDYDLTTDATPEQVKALLNDEDKSIIVAPSGIKFGTVTIVFKDVNETYEITTYRCEGRYSDSRHPDSISYSTSLLEDLKRRDFTINAMVINPLTRECEDHFDGMNDIKRHVIRCIGNPDERFSEDALRIMRAFRFAAVLGFDIEKETLLSMYKLIDTLDLVSKERLKDELTKALIPTRHSFAVAYKKYPFVMEKIIPEMKAMHTTQNNYYHVYDVMQHSLLTYENNPTDRIEIAMASLFHDIGKPATKTQELGLDHFFKHEYVGKEMIEDLMRRLKFSNRAIKYASFLVYTHMILLADNKRAVKKMLLKINKEFPTEDEYTILEDVIAIHKADCLSLNPDVIQDRMDEIARYREVIEQVKVEGEAFTLKDLAIDGRDMIALGYVRKEIGLALNFLLNAVISNEVKNEKESLIKYLKDNFIADKAID